MSTEERPRDEHGICEMWDCAIRNLGDRGVTAVQDALPLLAPEGELKSPPTYTSIEEAWAGLPGIFTNDVGATNFCLNKPQCSQRILAIIAMALEAEGADK